MPRSNGNGLERWRGEVTAHLSDITKRLDELGTRFEAALANHANDDRTHFERIDARLVNAERTQSKLSGKIAVVAGLIGAAVTAAADAAIRHFTG